MSLTSRKLAATFGGLVSTLIAFGFFVFGHVTPPVAVFDKVLLAITTITLAAIGAQTYIDGRNGNNT